MAPYTELGSRSERSNSIATGEAQTSQGRRLFPALAAGGVSALPTLAAQTGPALVGKRGVPLAPALATVLGGLSLIGLYLGLVSWAQGFGHARELLWGDRYFVAAIAGGFGLQVGLFVHVRRLLARRAAGSAAGVTAAGTGTSTVAMVACCAHHLTDALPVLGLSGAAIFLNDYRIPLMATGLAVNAAGVALMLRLAITHTRRVRAEAAVC